MEIKDGIPAFYAKDRKAWRNWLKKNAAREKSVWLIIYKKAADIKSVNYIEAVEEALCFGWIDSKPNKRDTESFYQFFARRKPASNWSKINKDRVDKLISLGLMTLQGMEAVELAKKSGTWRALDDVENIQLPIDLQEAFNQNEAAGEYFSTFPKSVKKGILEWILNARSKQTREKRIKETVSLAEKNIRANQYKPKTSY